MSHPGGVYTQLPQLVSPQRWLHHGLLWVVLHLAIPFCPISALSVWHYTQLFPGHCHPIPSCIFLWAALYLAACFLPFTRTGCILLSLCSITYNCLIPELGAL